MPIASITAATATAVAAPRDRDAVVLGPPPRHWPDLLAAGHRRLADEGRPVGGLPLREARSRLRGHLVGVNAAYLARFGIDDVTLPADGPLVVCGHQPEVSHAGVWIKNVVCARLAAATGGAALHVLTDNDECSQHALAVPTGDAAAALLGHVAFDEATDRIAYEERQVHDREAVARFAPTAAAEMAAFGLTTSLPTFWDAATAALEPGDRLRDVLAAGRRAVDRGVGVATAETPLSMVLDHEVCRRFFADLLLRAGEFRGVHQRRLREYRREHGIGSRNHPVADLAVRDDLVETPLWVWGAGRPQRCRLFVCVGSGRCVLHDGDRPLATLPAGSPEQLAAALADAEPQVKVRPRALMTTALLRLLVADLFVHGIGGGQYDVLTDRICDDFLGMAPPPYAVATATLRLPIAPAYDADRHHALQVRLRELEWNPDRHIDDQLREQEPIAGLIEEKFELMEDAGTSRRERRARFRRFRELNDQLRPLVVRQARDVTARLNECDLHRASAEILGGRGFAVCLHSRRRLAELADAVAFPAPDLPDTDAPRAARLVAQTD